MDRLSETDVRAQAIQLLDYLDKHGSCTDWFVSKDFSPRDEGKILAELSNIVRQQKEVDRNV